MSSEWVEWHKGYEPGKPLSKRLEVVQDLIRNDLDHRRPGAIRAISVCAGDGRDLIEVLATHPRGTDVKALLVDLDPTLVTAGKARASQAGLNGVRFECGDASMTNAYEGAVPADLVLACGIYGNISDSDIQGMIRRLPGLCAAGATVIWTRGRFEPDLTPAIRRWFAEAGFQEISFVAIPDTTMSVGAHRLAVPPQPFRPDVRLFTFLPREQRPSTLAKTSRQARDSSDGD